VSAVLWVTWRQHRLQVLVAVAFVVVSGGFLLFHGLRTGSVVATFEPGSAGYDNALARQFNQLGNVLLLSAGVPASLGLFLGAPLLAREYERGTYLLAWTQSVSRQAWLSVKLAGLGAAVTVTGLGFGLAMYAWAEEFGSLRSGGRLANLELFVSTGIVPAAWWLFGFAVGVAAGVVLRKLLPAMVVTLVVFFLAYGVLLNTDVRLHYATPVHREQTAPVVPGEQLSINTRGGAEAVVPAGALLVASGWLDAAGVVLDDERQWACASRPDYLECMRDKGYRFFTDYHPADRYWRFQATEAGLLLVASLALGAVAWRRF
jgi:ABC-2 family transporter protein